MAIAENKLTSDKIVRRRSFEISQLREDRKDAYAQLIITLQGLLEENPRFTGQFSVNINCGGINRVIVEESANVQP